MGFGWDVGIGYRVVLELIADGRDGAVQSLRNGPQGVAFVPKDKQLIPLIFAEVGVAFFMISAYLGVRLQNSIRVPPHGAARV